MTSTNPQPETLKALFEASCARWRERPAFTSMGVTLAYGEIERLSAAFGAFLRERLGLAPGERVAIMLPNVLQYPVALIGALRAGLAVVNVNPLYTASELRYQLEDSGAAALVVLENFAHTAEHALAGTRVRHVIATQLGDLFPAPKRWLVNLVVKHVKRMVPAWRIPGVIAFRTALAHGGPLPETAVSPEDIAFLQYTGGTTGRPKGAVLTHGNMAANVRQTLGWAGGALKEGEETVVTALPLYHVFALTANFLLFFRLGGSNLLIVNPRDLPAFVGELKHHRFSGITGVNTLYAALLDAPGSTRPAAPTRANSRSRWRAAWPCTAASPSAGRRPPARRSSRATASPKPRPTCARTRSTRASGAASWACRCPRPRSPFAARKARSSRAARRARSARAARR
jgi:long-chain acyl-CoA synthetase